MCMNASPIPTELDLAAFDSQEIVTPMSIDKLRVVLERKLGVNPLATRSFFADFKAESKLGTLREGALLQAIVAEYGTEGGLCIARALAWFRNDRLMRKRTRAKQ